MDLFTNLTTNMCRVSVSWKLLRLNSLFEKIILLSFFFFCFFSVSGNMENNRSRRSVDLFSKPENQLVPAAGECFLDFFYFLMTCPIANRNMLVTFRCYNGVYSSKWRPATRAKGGGHSQTRGRAGVPEISESTVFFDWLVLHVILFNSNNTVQVFFFLLLFSSSVHFNYTLHLWLLIFWLKKKIVQMGNKVSWNQNLCRQHERRVLVLSDDDQFTVKVCANDPSIWTPNVLRSSCGGRGLKNRQKPLRVIFLPSSAWHVDHRLSIKIDIVGPGIVLVHAPWTQRLFLFCFVSRSTFHEFPFFFFFFFSSVVALHAQTLNNVGPLDCKFRLLRQRSLLSLGGKISVAEVMHLSDFERFRSELRVVLVVVTFFLSFSLWWSWTLLFFLVEIVSESTLIETSFARKPHGASISSLPSSPRATAPESWIFGANNVQALRRWGRPRQGMLGALEKKTWAWGMSPNLKFHTSANPHTCTEQTHESNGRFLDEPWWPRLLLSKFLPFPTAIRNPWKGLTLTRGGRFRWHLSIPQRCRWTCVRRPSTSVSRNWRFTFPFCSCNQERHRCCATCKCQTRARFGKKEAYQLPSKSEQRNNFRSTERTTFISLHELCTLCFARFSVSPTFLRANFWWIAPIGYRERPIGVVSGLRPRVCTAF